MKYIVSVLEKKKEDIIFACFNKTLYLGSRFIKIAMLLLLNSLTYFPTVESTSRRHTSAMYQM